MLYYWCMTINTVEFEDLVSPIYDGLFKFAWSRTKNHFEADFLLSRSLTKAYEKFSTFETGSNFKAWIKKIITNTFLDDKRHENVKPKTITDTNMTDQIWSEAKVKSDLVDEHVDLEANRDNNLRMYAKLSDEKRQIMEMYYVKGLKYREIADKLSIPIGTVMSRINRIKHELIDMKQEEEENSGQF
ncbi:ECF RNA polymerase sigma factor SigH [Actinomycetota bacterium]|nr:ECF RNA polymerase sigma factor SigH [Actinomycetota bacterium]